MEWGQPTPSHPMVSSSISFNNSTGAAVAQMQAGYPAATGSWHSDQQAVSRAPRVESVLLCHPMSPTHKWKGLTVSVSQVWDLTPVFLECLEFLLCFALPAHRAASS